MYILKGWGFSFFQMSLRRRLDKTVYPGTRKDSFVDESPIPIKIKTRFGS